MRVKLFFCMETIKALHIDKRKHGKFTFFMTLACKNCCVHFTCSLKTVGDVEKIFNRTVRGIFKNKQSYSFFQFLQKRLLQKEPNQQEELKPGILHSQTSNTYIEASHVKRYVQRESSEQYKERYLHFPRHVEQVPPEQTPRLLQSCLDE